MDRYLEVENLYKVYNKNQKEKKITAVKGISFGGYSGEILGILGPNGSGKTSIIKSIATLIEFEKGSIEVLGTNIQKKRKQVLQNMGAVLEGARNVYWNLSPIENMIYFAGLKGLGKRDVNTRIERYLSFLDLEKVANKPLRQFSKGMQQKVAIACSLIADPKLVLLDEPTLGLDIETSRNMQEFIKAESKENKLFVITSHDMKFIEKTCSRVLVIREGEIIAGDSIENLKTYFKKSAFKITVENGLPPEFFRDLSLISDFRKETPKEDENGEDGVELYFLFDTPEVIYSIIDVLKQHSAILTSIDIVKDDFEDIFLRILKEQNNESVSATIKGKIDENI
ncbi:ABC transporter ATP-binding protein [Chitinispirillum alkaliphilum]|nr:ABC transporter ATP-binding protein [Chitinispirillum alkaliphilum]